MSCTLDNDDLYYATFIIILHSYLTFIIIIIEGLSLLQSIPPTTTTLLPDYCNIKAFTLDLDTCTWIIPGQITMAVLPDSYVLGLGGGEVFRCVV